MSLKESPRRYTKEEMLALLDPLVARWFRAKFEVLTEPQEYAIPLIHARKNVLVSAPTGSGKTLTAFLSIINELVIKAHQGRLEDEIFAIYVSPLKALANDIERNLNQPLREIRELAKGDGIDFPEIRVGVRTGDTPQSERQKMLRKPPHLFITTPESLTLVITAPKFKEKIANAKYLILDEIHDLCPNKRGVLFSLTMERLAAQQKAEFTRIGLSATQAPIEEIARYLGGLDADGEPRPIEIIEVAAQKSLDLKVLCPVEDLTAFSFDVANQRMYELLDGVIRKNKTTLVFTNTRSGTESVTYRLKESGLDLVEAHHGSLGRETRLDVERRLKSGELKAVVTSTSLELGIDIGHVGIVIQIGSPKSVARGIQRIGRAGHSYGATSVGRFIAFDSDELVECAVLTRCARLKKIDRVDIPHNSLDVLAQTIVAMSLEKRWGAKEAFALVRRSHCYRDLPWEDFEATLNYLSGRLFEETLFGKIWFDPAEGTFGKKRTTRLIYFTNMGTIPEEASFLVVGEANNILGDLSEAFIERLERGDIFVLGGKTYEFLAEKKMRVYVRDARGRRPTVPSWSGEMLPRSFDLSLEIAAFRRELEERLRRGDDPMPWLMSEFSIDEGSARTIVSYAKSELATLGFLPNDRHLGIEGYVDPKGNANLIFHFPFGRRVNDALSRAWAARISSHFGCNVRVSVNDDAFMITAPRSIPLDRVPGMLKSDELASELRRAVRNTEMFKQRFRHCATRALMVLRNYKGHDISVVKQQLRSERVLDVLHEIPDFPVIKEAYNEILTMVMDIGNAKRVLEWIDSGATKVDVKNYSDLPSPFGHNIILAGTSDIVLMEDRSQLLRELHRQILAKAFGGTRAFRFEHEAVAQYFRDKIGRVKGRADVKRVLRIAGPIALFVERGRSVYRYSDVPYEKLRAWCEELLAGEEVASVFTTESVVCLPEDLPFYAALFKRSLPEGDVEVAIRAALATGGATSKELRSSIKSEGDRFHEAVRLLEANWVTERAGFRDGEVVWRPRPDQRRTEAPKDAAFERAVRHLVGGEGPLSLDEIALRLRMADGDVARGLEPLLREGLVQRDMFVPAEREQYMLSADVVRLQETGKGVVADESQLLGLLVSRQFGLESEAEFFERFLWAHDPQELAVRVSRFEMKRFLGLLQSTDIVHGRFLGGEPRFTSRPVVRLLAGLLRERKPEALAERVFGIVKRNPWIDTEGVQGFARAENDRVKDALRWLEEHLHLSRLPAAYSDDGKSRYHAIVSETAPASEAVSEVILRSLRFRGPMPASALAALLGAQTEDLRETFESLSRSGAVKRLTVAGAEQQELWMAAEDEAPLASATAPARAPEILHPRDPYSARFESRLRAEYGDTSWGVFENGRPFAGAELWVEEEFVEVRDLRVEPERVGAAGAALKAAMVHFSERGSDLLIVRKVNGQPPSPTVADLLAPVGYSRFESGLVLAAQAPVSLTPEEMMQVVLRRQHLDPSTRFTGLEELIRGMHGLRSVLEIPARLSQPKPLPLDTRFQRLFSGPVLPDYVHWATVDDLQV
ncbi:MAG TPA: ATP-dependent helicase, partial [Thermoplasmata archaeon]|nr:ATP-dependent helicase [Thermoplasmata archaeon]